MRRRFNIFALFSLFSATPSFGAKWDGVDDTVVGKFAETAGRKAVDPGFFGQGDIPVFMFLTAGVVGGFFIGYFFRQIFPPKADGEKK